MCTRAVFEENSRQCASTETFLPVTGDNSVATRRRRCDPRKASTSHSAVRPRRDGKHRGHIHGADRPLSGAGGGKEEACLRRRQKITPLARDKRAEATAINDSGWTTVVRALKRCNRSIPQEHKRDAKNQDPLRFLNGPPSRRDS